MSVIVAQLGARHHYAVPRILHEAGLLARFYTDSYIGNKPRLAAALGLVPPALRPRPLSRWLGRRCPELPAAKVTSFEAFGWRLVQARRQAQDTAALAALTAAAGRRFCERIIQAGPPAAATVFGYDGASLELFRWAKARGLRCVLDQTIAPRPVLRRLLAQELARWPGWEPGLQLPPEPDPLAVREAAEWQLADRILCPSEFVREHVIACGGPAERCVLVPYGIDTSRFAPPASKPPLAGRRLRVLFVGAVGLRKGAPYALEALRQLGPAKVEARFAGQLQLDPAKLAPYHDVATCLGPVPRSEMPKLFTWADVFLLPSLCEGSAGSINEALASGLPVIATYNAGINHAAAEGQQLVAVRDSAAIAHALERLAKSMSALPQAELTEAVVQAVSIATYRQSILRSLT